MSDDIKRERDVVAAVLALEQEIQRRDVLLQDMANALNGWLGWVGAVRFNHGTEKRRERALHDAQIDTSGCLERWAAMKAGK